MNISISYEDLIRRRAFEIYEYRQEYGVEGTAEGDWLLAEEEFRRVGHNYLGNRINELD